MHELKEEIKEKDDNVDSLKTTFNNIIADLKVEINEKQTELNNMQDCHTVMKGVQQLQTNNLLQKRWTYWKILFRSNPTNKHTKNNITEVKQCTMQDNVITAY